MGDARGPERAAWLRSVARAVRYADVRHDLVHEWRRRWAGGVSLPEGPVARVLVICHGNICRSPFAEHLLARARPDLEVRSAGLAASEGAPAEPGARRAARRFGLDLERHAAHRLAAPDVAWADLILGMQGHHQTAVARSWPEGGAKVRLLGDFLETPPHAIPDPWGLDDAVFGRVFDQIALATESLRRRLPCVRREA